MKRSDIEDILIKIGVPAGIKGFKYITDAVLILYNDSEISMTKELYPMIAKKNETTGNRVERAIRHAFEVARSPKRNYDAVEHYIGFTNCSNANSLKMPCSRIKAQQEESERKIRDSQNSNEEMIRRIIREELKTFMGGIV